jgi:hypothetical protein
MEEDFDTLSAAILVERITDAQDFIAGLTWGDS